MSRRLRRFRTPALLLAFFAPLAACSSESSSPAVGPVSDDAATRDGGDAGAGDPAIPASNYCESIVEPFCDFYLRCKRMVAASADECRAVFLETCNERYEPRDVDLEKAGLISLSSRGVAACAAHLGSVSCEEQTSDLDGPCGGMWLGTSPAGSPCGIDVESFVCAPGTACILGLDLCGKCENAAPIGAACGSGVRCAPQGSCVGGSCVARSLPGKPCSDQAPCTTGARCVSGTCVAPVTVGEGDPCDNEHRCAYRSVCEQGSCVRTSLLGETCTTDRGCASGRCVSGKCTKLASDGATCKASSECSSGLCAKGTCTPLPSACFQR